MPHDIDYRQMVEEIAEVVELVCNEWECEFIENVLDWIGEYTDKQKEVIDRIYQRACESPY